MDTCLHKRMDPGTISDNGWDRSGVCAACHQTCQSFYVENEEDRRGGWSRWKAVQYVINEEQELTWNDFSSLSISWSTTSVVTSSATTLPKNYSV